MTLGPYMHLSPSRISNEEGWQHCEDWNPNGLKLGLQQPAGLDGNATAFIGGGEGGGGGGGGSSAGCSSHRSAIGISRCDTSHGTSFESTASGLPTSHHRLDMHCVPCSRVSSRHYGVSFNATKQGFKHQTACHDVAGNGPGGCC